MGSIFDLGSEPDREQFGEDGVSYVATLNGMIPDGETDCGPAFQALLDKARAERRAIVIPPGVYYMGTTALGFNGGNHVIGMASGPVRFGATEGVILKWSSAMTGRCVTINAGNVWLENLTVDSNNCPGTGWYVLGAFEGRYDDIRIINTRGIGLHMRAISNTSYRRFYVDNCGTGALPAVLLESVNHSMNTLDFSEVHIERQVNTALHIGPLTIIGDGSTQRVPEFLRILNLHVEAVSDNGGTLNTDALVKITLSRSVCFINPFIYGGPGPLVVHDFPGGTVYDGVAGGVQVIGGTLLGRNAPDTPANLVRLIRGNQFTAIGVRFDNSTGVAVDIASTYGGSAFIDSSCIMGRVNAALVTDARTAHTPLRMHHDVSLRRHFLAVGDPVNLAIQAQNGTDAPAPAAVNANDVKGVVFFGSGTAPAVGPQFRLTFARPYLVQPTVQITPSNSAAAGLQAFVSTDLNGFTIHARNAPAANTGGTTHQFHYLVTG